MLIADEPMGEIVRNRKYDQDLIHFHDFLSNERIRKNVTQANLCRGLCSISMMARIESGERLPDKLLRDRFLGRLGVAREGYEDYLQPGEYVLWERKQKIIYDYEHEMWEQAGNEVAELFKAAEKGNQVCRQFCLLMKAVLLQRKGGDRREAAGYLERAGELTMPEVRFGNLHDYVLSAQEIYILIKLLAYKELTAETGEVGKAKSNEIDIEKAYIELLDYVWESFLDDIEKVKVYSLIVVQYDSWYQAVTTIYKRYDVEAEMTSDLYLYKDTETYCISTVIHDRRMMLGYSIAELAEDICSEKTLRRIESGKENAQMPIVLEIFERLGLSGEYTKAEVIAYDYATEILVDKLAHEMNECEYDCAMQDLDELEKILPHNKANEQFCKCHRNNLQYRLKYLNEEKYQKNMLTVIGLSVPFNKIQVKDCFFLTTQESICIYNIANKINNVDQNKYVEILRKMKIEKEYLKDIHMLLYELIMTWMASNAGNQGRYGYSDQISNETIYMCLHMKRINMIAKNLFNNIWNYLEKNGENAEKSRIVVELKCCIAFSQIWRDCAFEKFCNERLKMFNDGLLHL